MKAIRYQCLHLTECQSVLLAFLLHQVSDSTESIIPIHEYAKDGGPGVV